MTNKMTSNYRDIIKAELQKIDLHSGGPDTPRGTEADGSASEDYCSYCYQGGQFAGEMTMEEMIDFCAPMMVQGNPGMTQEQAKAQMHQFFPMLKRWRR